MPQRLPWLAPHQPFPHPSRALGQGTDYPGLLALGGVLDATTLRMAYAQGIFPWYSDDQPILWWSTHPRMVLQPQQFKLHKSLRKTLQAFRHDATCEIRTNTCFETVMRHCAQTLRAGQHGTWITEDIVQAYCELHAQGQAYSVETWINQQLVGGLYGVALGHAVFGESMFAHSSNASKIALAALVCLCRAQQVPQIDCQQETPHLASLGAAPIDREDFLQVVQQQTRRPAMQWQWHDALWQQLLPT